jgi:DNA-binding NarL/FixJ family response regulator
VVYKGKSLEKTLLRAGDKIDDSDKEMKTINVNGVRYFIQDKEDEMNLVHELVRQGYTISQIAGFLNISEGNVRKILEDCWGV